MQLNLHYFNRVDGIMGYRGVLLKLVLFLTKPILSKVNDTM